ncbi:MAG: nitronate monooxygenase [Candidatus Lokiarchaeota archaeon]|nr:nitronate monooxygenase [Candidatus Lokiarchaeota archaeon]
MLGIEYPIIQAPMGPYDTKDLAVAVSNAGGFGMASHPVPDPQYGIATIISDDETRAKAYENIKQKFIGSVRHVAANAKGNFGVNFRVATVQFDVPMLLDELLKEYDTNPAVKKKLRVVICSAGDPSQRYLRKIKDAGLLRFHTVPSVYHAKKAEKSGVDAIVVTGYEAGGHVAHEPFHTFVTVPEVIKSVNLPVIAGGGVCDGSGLVAMLAFGAQAIYMGTRFIVTKECEFNDKVKVMIMESSVKNPREDPTIVTQGVYGPLRHLKNKFAFELAEMTQKLKRKEISIEDVYKFESAATYRAKGEEGNLDDGAIWCGQVAVRLHEKPSCKDVVDGIMAEATEIMQRLGKLAT